MNRGDVYMVPLDPTAGREQRGTRPVVIITPQAFNQVTLLPVVLPITNGGNFASKIGFAVPLNNVKTTGIVRCDQPRTCDIQARKGWLFDHLPDEIMDVVMAKIQGILA